MELNKEQVIKALECCINDECDKCGYTFGDCQHNLMREALSLIKELTEENERLSQSLANSKSILANSKADTVRKMQAEIEARCIKGGIYPAFVKSTIDNIAKEMFKENGTMD